MKEVNEKACYLELAPGLHDVRYNQTFVHAPASAYPKTPVNPEPNFAGSEAMRVTMGK